MIYVNIRTRLGVDGHHVRCTTESYDTGTIGALVVESSCAHLVAISNKSDATGDQ